ncbi:hypothetical protein [Desulfocicer niacini]
MKNNDKIQETTNFINLDEKALPARVCNFMDILVHYVRTVIYSWNGKMGAQIFTLCPGNEIQNVDHVIF